MKASPTPLNTTESWPSAGRGLIRSSLRLLRGVLIVDHTDGDTELQMGQCARMWTDETLLNIGSRGKSEGASYHDRSTKVIKDDMWASVGKTGVWVQP